MGSDVLIVLVIILVVVFVLRGPKTLPKWGSALGRGVREARTEAAKAQTEIQARAAGTPAAPGAPSAGTPAPGTPAPGMPASPDGTDVGRDRPA